MGGHRMPPARGGSLVQRGARSAAPGLRQAREAAGVTQAELAAKTGWSVQALAALEGGAVVSMTEVSRVAAALGVDPAALRQQGGSGS